MQSRGGHIMELILEDSLERRRCALVKENSCFLKIISNHAADKCLKQIKLPNLLQPSESYNELPCNTSTMGNSNKLNYVDVVIQLSITVCP